MPIINGSHDPTRQLSIGTGEEEIITVPVKKLDEYDFAGVSFIKIDVEGQRNRVLKGAENTIHLRKPTFRRNRQRHLTIPMQKVFDLILSYGYSGFFVQGKLANLRLFLTNVTRNFMG